MSQLIESIKLKDGKYHNLFYHERRMNYSLRTLSEAEGNFDLAAFLQGVIAPENGLFKCRIVYDCSYKKVEFAPYEVRPIRTLKVVEDDRISYELKYDDRTEINKLFDQRNSCDDILIVRNGMVTDSSIANIVFRRNKKWFTPRTPLLRGTMRAKLLDQKFIHEEDIGVADLENFESFKLINAMLEFESEERDISNIVF